MSENNNNNNKGGSSKNLKNGQRGKESNKNIQNDENINELENSSVALNIGSKKKSRVTAKSQFNSTKQASEL